VYTVVDYGRMLADRVRVDAYRRALAAVVKPGAVVVDLGAGTGFFSLEACRLGAAKVYAIEINDALSLLPLHARRNGFADRIEVLACPSTEVELPRKADVIVSDLRGVVPLFGANVAVLADARARLLAPGGVILPARDVLQIAVVEASELHGTLVEGWTGHGLDLADARACTVNVFHEDRRAPIRPEQLASDARPWAEITYGVDPPPLVERTVHLAPTRAATCHGLATWFDATLFGDIGFTTAPGSDRVYGRGFFPWEEPVALELGDDVEVHLVARRGGGDHLWAWATTVTRAGRTVAAFRQSTFLSTVIRPGALAKESTSYRPALSPRGRAVRAILARMEGEAEVGIIAGEVHAAHPGAFASAAEALEETRRLAKRYG